MKLHIDPDWILRMAEKENNCIISVGGFWQGGDVKYPSCQNPPHPFLDGAATAIPPRAIETHQ